MGDIARRRYHDRRADERPDNRGLAPEPYVHQGGPHDAKESNRLQGGNIEQAIGPGNEEVTDRAEEAGAQEQQELPRRRSLPLPEAERREADGADDALPQHYDG